MSALAERRRAFALGLAGIALVLAGLLAALVVSGGGRALRLPLAPMLEAGHLEIAFKHSLRSGTLEIWVDDELVLDESLEGRETRKIRSLRQHSGSLSRTLDVAPGECVVRVQVEGDHGFQQREAYPRDRRKRGQAAPGGRGRGPVPQGAEPFLGSLNREDTFPCPVTGSHQSLGREV